MKERLADGVRPRTSQAIIYAALGALFGLFFPLVASLILVYQNRLSPGLASIVQVQRGEPLLWIIDTAPLFLGLFAYFAGVRQESLLHLMENLNRVMLENIPDSALILDEQQRVIDLNASALQVLGLSKLQAQRWPVSSVVPGWPRAIGVLQSARVPEHWETTIDASVSGGARHGDEHSSTELGERTQKDAKGSAARGRARIYDVRVSPLYGWQGPGKYIVILRDISDIKQRANELSTLLEATRAVSSALVYTSSYNPENILSRIVEQMAKALDANDCSISRWDKETGAVVVWVQEWGQEASQASQVGDISYLKDLPSTRAVLQNRQPLTVLASDPQADAAKLEQMRTRGVRSLLMLPLAVGDRVFGLVELGNTGYERVFSPDELQLAQALADQAAIAIENARLYSQAQANLEEIQSLHRQYMQQAWSDALGGAEALEYTFERPARARKPAPAATAPTKTQVEEEGRDAQAANGKQGQPRSLQVPIRLRDQVIGALTLEAEPLRISDSNAEGEPWTTEELALVEAVANQAALALENARLLQEMQRTAERERLAASLASKVWTSTDIETILQTALQELGRSMQVSEGLIQIDLQPEQESYS